MEPRAARFLTAEWRYLVILNYEIDPAVLRPFLPAGTELDQWNGKTFVSMVGFQFLNTKLLGLAIPFHSNFEEVNLRFYVRRWTNESWRRAVVFIKEVVPSRAIAWTATAEPFEEWLTNGILRAVRTAWNFQPKAPRTLFRKALMKNSSRSITGDMPVNATEERLNTEWNIRVGACGLHSRRYSIARWKVYTERASPLICISRQLRLFSPMAQP